MATSRTGACELLKLISDERLAASNAIELSKSQLGDSSIVDHDQKWAQIFSLYLRNPPVDEEEVDDMLFFVKRSWEKAQVQDDLYVDSGEEAEFVSSSASDCDYGDGSSSEDRNEESSSTGTDDACCGQDLCPFIISRRGSPQEPIAGAPHINWEETVCINAILHHFQYTLAVAVCEKKLSYSKLKIQNRVTKRVYPTPSKRRMDIKGGTTEYSWPFITFSIDDFEAAYGEMRCDPDQQIAVQLVARDPHDSDTDKPVTIFQGGVKFEALLAIFKWKKGMGLNQLWTGRREEFLSLTGPRGKGEAQMAVFATHLEQSQGLLSKWFNRAPPVLTCQLTFITLPWESIINDLIWRS